MDEDKPKNESEVARKLRHRYPQPEWAFLTQVRSQTGFSQKQLRTADAIAINTYPSRGMAMHGFEIKVSRTDWLKELQSPDKSIEMQQYCDYWWIVVNDKDIVKTSELPDNWGLIVVGNVCKVIKDAPKLESIPPTKHLLASLMRNVTTGFVHPFDMEERIERARQSATYGMDQEHKALKKLEERVIEFEKASGVELIHAWESGKMIGEAVKFALKNQAKIKSDAEWALRQVAGIAKSLQDLIDKS